MDREPGRAMLSGACVEPVKTICEAADRTSARRRARESLLIRAAVTAYIVSNGVIAYLLFATA